MMLLGGAITILKNMKVNGKDDIPYMKWKKKVWNHQPVNYPQLTKNGPKMGLSQIIHFDRMFHCKPSILGYPHVWKTLNGEIMVR